MAHALGTHLDLFQRIVVSPCSVSAILVTAGGPVVLAVNSTGDDLSTLFVTTSTREATDAHPYAGALFAVETAARGQEPRYWTR